MSPPPGRELVEAVHRGEDAGLPVWIVPTTPTLYLMAPRLLAVPSKRGPLSPGRVSFEREFARRAATGRCVFDPELLALRDGRPRNLSPLALHTISAPPLESLAVGARARGESTPRLRWLAAAILRDLGGLAQEELAVELRHTGNGAARAARRDVVRGRALWREIPGAWPWWTAPDAIPGEWWREPQIIAAWRVWQGGALPDERLSHPSPGPLPAHGLEFIRPTR